MNLILRSMHVNMCCLEAYVLGSATSERTYRIHSFGCIVLPIADTDMNGKENMYNTSMLFQNYVSHLFLDVRFYSTSRCVSNEEKKKLKNAYYGHQYEAKA